MKKVEETIPVEASIPVMLTAKPEKPNDCTEEATCVGDIQALSKEPKAKPLPRKVDTVHEY